MFSKATVKYIRMSPRKVRQVADLIRGKDVDKAFAILFNVKKLAVVYVGELLKSAVSNAKRKQMDLNPEDLRITKLTVDGGPTMVRYRAASMGRGSMIRRRMSHIKIELDVKEEAKKSKKAKGKVKKSKER